MKTPLSTYLYIFFILLFTWGNGFSQNQQNYKEKKLKLYSFYFDGCGACKYMDSEILAKDVVKNYIQQNFDLMHINGLVSPGIVLAQKYHITTYPSFIFTDSISGTPFYRIEGAAKNPDDFIAELKYAKSSYLKKKPVLANFAKLYNSKKQDILFVSGYIETLKALGGKELKIDSVFSVWFSAANKPAVLNDNIAMTTVLQNLNHLKSSQYQFFKAHQDQFKKRFSQKEIEPRIAGAIENSLVNHIAELDSIDLKEITDFIQQSELVGEEEKREITSDTEISFYMKKKNFTKAIVVAQAALNPLFEKLKECTTESCKTSIIQDIVVKINNTIIADLNKSDVGVLLVKNSLIGWVNALKEMNKYQANNFINMLDERIRLTFGVEQ